MNRKRVLIVDDDEAIIKSLKSLLESEGYLVETASTGVEALEKTEENVYDLAILDIRLPDIEGTELLAEMREETPRMMKIMFTGHASLDNAIEALNLGADAYLTKPAKPEELIKVVKEKLKEQDDAEKINEEKFEKWMKARMQKTGKLKE